MRTSRKIRYGILPAESSEASSVAPLVFSVLVILIGVIVLCWMTLTGRAADMGGCKVVSPTPGATVTVTIDPQVRHTVAQWTASEIETINISGTPQDGNMLTLLITNDATLGRVITLGTGLSSLGVATGVASKKSTITMIAYSGTFYEVSRTVGF
jgi:hypothetical protein